MGKMMRKQWRSFQGSNCIILALYLVCVVLAQGLLHGKISLISILIALLAAPTLLYVCSKISFESKAGKNKKIPRVAFYIVPLLLLFLHFFAYYPGAIGGDNMWQYTQAETNKYNDWHPVLHTLLAMKIPQLLTGGWVAAPTLFQNIFFSIILGYALNVCLDYLGAAYSIGFMLLVILNPQTGNILMYPWKDVGFGICALLLLTYGLRIYKTSGKWLNSHTNIISFVIVSAVTAIVRHNGILFVLPIVIGTSLYVNWRKALVIFGLIVLLILGIKVPLYSALQVELPERGLIETMGVPANIIGAVATYDPEALDDEMADFAYGLSPKETWESKYSLGNYNAVKWEESTDNKVLDEYGVGGVLRMTIKCFQRSPEISAKALLSILSPLYSLESRYNINVSPKILNTGTKFEQTGNSDFRQSLEKYCAFTSEHFYHVFMSLGVMHLMMLVVLLSKSRLNKAEDWKRILFPMAIFTYNWGTAMMLTGIWDAIRFFWYTFLVIPVAIAFFVEKKSENLTVKKS